MLKSSPNITTGHYCRLMAVCTVEIVFTVPLGIYSIVLSATDVELIPYVSWENIHKDFSYIGQLPIDVLESTPITAVAIESSRWSYVFCAFVLFVFFGLSRGVKEGYYHAFQIFTCYIGVTRFVQRNTPTRSVACHPCIHRKAGVNDRLEGCRQCSRPIMRTQRGRFLHDRAVVQYHTYYQTYHLKDLSLPPEAT